jgi:hypothetical protein
MLGANTSLWKLLAILTNKTKCANRASELTQTQHNNKTLASASKLSQRRWVEVE